MTRPSQTRISRNYRNRSPGAFHTFNQSVRNHLAENRIPVSTWAANPGLLSVYFETSDKHDAAFHRANYRSVLDIAERDALQARLVDYLDEIAADLEAEAVRNPDILLSSGFDLAKERRSTSRKRIAAAAEAAVGEPQGTNP